MRIAFRTRDEDKVGLMFFVRHSGEVGNAEEERSQLLLFFWALETSLRQTNEWTNSTYLFHKYEYIIHCHFLILEINPWCNDYQY